MTYSTPVYRYVSVHSVMVSGADSPDGPGGGQRTPVRRSVSAPDRDVRPGPSARSRAGALQERRETTPTLAQVQEMVSWLGAIGEPITGGKISRLTGWSKATVNRRLTELRESSSSPPGGAITSGYLASLMLEIARQDRIHPSGFPATRDGLRLALAAAQDELDESRESWRDGRPRPGRDADWTACRTELVQLAAVALRAVRAIDRAAISRSKPPIVEMRTRVVVHRDLGERLRREVVP